MLSPRNVASCLFALLAVGLLAAHVNAAEWGTIKGRFVYDGTAPAPKKLILSKDPAVCELHHPVDETLLVDSCGGLANVIVSIRVKRGTKLEVHPDYEATANDKIELDNKFCRFAPHIGLIRTSQTLVLKNSDPVGHNTNAVFFANPSFNSLIPAGKSQEFTLEKAEARPASVGCNIHPWMAGYLIVRDDPYAAVSAVDGTFEIKNVPAGEHEFAFWQEKVGNLADLSFAGAKTSRRGRVKLTIPAGGELDLGEIKVSEKIFAGK